MKEIFMTVHNREMERTVRGLDVELQVHYVLYRAGIKKNRTKVADMGEPRQDSNARIFEHLGVATALVSLARGGISAAYDLVH